MPYANTGMKQRWDTTSSLLPVVAAEGSCLGSCPAMAIWPQSHGMEDAWSLMQELVLLSLSCCSVLQSGLGEAACCGLNLGR